MKQQLEISIDKSLTWINNNLHYFNINSNDVEKNPNLDMQRKRLGELAITLLILSRNTSYKEDYRAKKIISFIKEICNSKDFYRGITRDLNLFPFYLMLYNGLYSMKIEFKDYKQLLQNIIDANFMDCIERTAWNQIDFKYQLDFGGFKHNMASYDQMYKTSSLYHLPNLIHIRDIDVYALTHILFHLTDFGNKNIDHLLEDKKDKTAEHIGNLMIKYALKEDWDLLAELLICCHNLNYRNHPLFIECWQKLLNAQNKKGDFTSRYIQEKLKKGEMVNDKDVFDVNYHPTLVGLFACLLEHEYLIN
ncbi:hypothetical protein MPF19_15285 [Polaribacter sp. Z014]|uniref:DUF6895 family protein n=1 Tax=unclassified Polaribacter TaxID=196858 RepID=UPI00193B772C|nr:MULTISPECIES: hypothetical protein [unclassified Polaribacter]MCL7764786.1 hypothetical protein [Polaribacter sp. Z014]QVY64845.1 hypothetical protein JOP69_13880 [Polaribacter sp. Q13]